MKLNKNIILGIVVIIVFIIGLCFSLKPSHEGFKNKNKECYDMLIRENKKIYLFQKNRPRVPGVNPIEFDNLDEYTEFVDWQRSKGIRCPVLYLQRTYDTQNNPILKTSLDPLFSNDNVDMYYDEKEIYDGADTKLIDANRQSSYFNKNTYPGFDPDNQYIGNNTPLDKMFHSSDPVSDNAADTHWGGIEHTRRQIDSGKYINYTRQDYIPDDPTLLQKEYNENERFFNTNQKNMNRQIGDYYKARSPYSRKNVRQSYKEMRDRRNYNNNVFSQQNKGKKRKNSSYSKYIKNMKRQHRHSPKNTNTNANANQ